MHRFFNLVTRFGRDERGVFAIVFALIAIVLIAFGGATVDYVSLQQARNRAQVALDAAALALQPEIFKLTKEQIRANAEALMIDRIGSEWGVVAGIKTSDVTIDLERGSLYLKAGMTMPTTFVSLVGVKEMAATIASEATRGSIDVEVAVALDLSASMSKPIPGAGTTTKIESLKTALNTLIDLIVLDDQSPTYSKMALVPYSVAVNVGGFANTVRGSIVPPTAITNITWFSAINTVTGAARASASKPVTITTKTNHGFSTGDYVLISGVRGTTQVNDKIFQITVTVGNTKEFTLDGTTKGSYSAYTDTGTVWKCLTPQCELVVTSPGHGLRTGDYAYVSGAGGMETFPTTYTANSTAGKYDKFDNYTTNQNVEHKWINNNPSTDDFRFIVWKVGTADTNTFVLPGTSRLFAKAYGTYTSGGTVSCVLEGCSQFRFTNPYSGSGYSNPTNTSQRRNPISTCVTERDTNTFTDASYTTTLVGRNYPAAANDCLADVILPLTHARGAADTKDKATLHGVANTLTASGSTGGQIGVAWAWYLLSHTFNGPWPAESQPASTGSTRPVVKAVVIMTDGEYNSIYKQGVIAKNSTAGSGDTYSMIGQNALNGSSYEQTAALCAAMKKAGIIVYTVGLAIDDKPVAQQMMAGCASDPSKAYVAGTGQALEDVFRDIAENLSQLRITN